MANILQAIYRVVTNPIIEVRDYYSGRNRANSVGDAMENYVKDLLCDSFDIIDENERIDRFHEIFSYLGNQNNPPDIIIRGGDAIETKKVQSRNSALALNSSYPKSKLYSDSSMIIEACRTCEDWDIKDIIYAVGHTDDNNLKYLWFVYGNCFAASREIYERIKTTISDGINLIPDVEFTETNELGKVKKVDPLGITDLRVRGMWHIDNPHKVFTYLNCVDDSAKFQLISLMRKDKFESFPSADQSNLLNLQLENFSLTDVRFKNPDNPADLIDGKLITYRVY